LTDNENGLSYDLQVIDRAKDKVIYEIQVHVGDLISYSYIHSSDGTPVEQIFELDPDGILQLKEERYEWQGAGLETGTDKEITVINGQVRVTGYNRAFPELPLRVARTVSQELEVNNNIIRLNDLAPGGTSLIIRTTK